MKNNRSGIRTWIAAALVVAAGVSGAFAQNSLPAPGSGGAFTPNPGPAMGGFGPAFNPGPPPPTYWGSPWYDGSSYNPTIVVSPSIQTGNFSDQGITKVVACGYDATGVWRVLPLLVSYQDTGGQYLVNVLNAWNPWTDEWDKGVDVQAFNTDYTLRGVNYDYYVVLSFGTFYFNL